MGTKASDFEKTFDSLGMTCPFRSCRCLKKKCTHFITDMSEKATKYKCYAGAEPIDLWIEVILNDKR